MTLNSRERATRFDIDLPVVRARDSACAARCAPFGAQEQGRASNGILHRVCHRQIHALLTETELARQYATVAALLAHPELSSFVAWVKTKPEDFFVPTRKSRRLRR